jgi:hypothetical protein
MAVHISLIAWADTGDLNLPGTETEHNKSAGTMRTLLSAKAERSANANWAKKSPPPATGV